jgi:alpha-tubulin suppressor-like RCC1 family protein
MTNIKDIDIKDVNYFLDHNRISRTVGDPYTVLWNFLSSNRNTNIKAPESITDWVLAYNISSQEIKKYDSVEIMMSNDDNLKDLSRRLGLNSVDKTRIVRILNYLNKLTISINLFNELPDELIVNILLMTDDFYKFCSLSNKFNSVCNNEFVPYLRHKLKHNTGLNTDKYNREQLFYLSQQQKHRYKTRIAPSGGYTLLISGGKVYACGIDSNGALGLGDILQMDTPTKIPNLQNIVEVSVGFNHSLALTNDGRVYAFGKNDKGQLGINSKEDNIFEPTLIPGLNNVISVLASKNYSFVLTSEGDVYVFGEKTVKGGTEIFGGAKGQLVKLDKLKDVIQMASDRDELFLLDINGNVYEYHYTKQPEKIDFPKKINSITVGSTGLFALDINNKLHISNIAIRDLSAEEFDDFKIKRIFNPVTYVDDTSNVVYILDESGNVYMYNVNDKNDHKWNIPNVVDVGVSVGSAYFVDNEGNLYVRGLNNNGQLGIGLDRKFKNQFILNPNLKIY